MPFHAPYNFVPLSEHVLFPDWAAQTSHDIPLRDGYCGWMQIVITARSPIMVGNEVSMEGTPRAFCKRPGDGPFVIPGATLRGLIRNLLEIATFGKFSQVDDTCFSVRDLDNAARHFYRDHFIASADGVTISRVKAGWLRFVAGQWQLRPCDYARIEQGDIQKQVKALTGQTIDLHAPQTAEDKYKALQDAGGGVARRAVVGTVDHHKPFGTLRYKKCLRFDPAGQVVFLVFSGQPERSRKHMEFVFYPPGNQSLTVGDDVMQQFLANYGKSAVWRFLHSPGSPHQARGIPVFWLGEASPTSLGLSQLYRLPYPFSVWDMIRHTHADHLSEQPDFAEILFGRIGGGQGAGKGRVFFGDACLDGKPQLGAPFTGVLSSPKPSYYPAYVRQTSDPNHSDRVVNSTYQQNGQERYRFHYASYAPPAHGTPLENQDPKIQGWKRYPARERLITPDGGQERVEVTFIPLAAESRFVGRVRLHNLHREEIGALVWALEWGGRQNLRHLIGMAKAFGYGQVTIAITGGEIRPNRFVHGKPLELVSLKKHSHRDSWITWKGVMRKSPSALGRRRYKFVPY